MRKSNFILALAILLLPSVSAYAGNNIQMLPPTGCPASGNLGVLGWVNDGVSTLGCIPGFTADSTGNFSSNSLTTNSITDYGNLTVSGTTNLNGITNFNGATNFNGNASFSNIDGQTVNSSSIQAANNLASALAGCGSSGGPLSVDANGNIKCAASTSAISFYSTCITAAQAHQGNGASTVTTGPCPNGKKDTDIYSFSANGTTCDLHICQ